MNILNLPDFVLSQGFRFDKNADMPHVAAIRGSKSSLQNCAADTATFARLGFVKPEQRNLLSRLKCVFSSRLTQGKRAAGRYEAYLHGGAKQQDVAFMKLLQQLAYASKTADAQAILRAMTPAARKDFLQRMKTIVEAARAQQTSGHAALDGRPTAERVNILSGIRSVAALWQSVISTNVAVEYDLVVSIQAGIAEVEAGRSSAAQVRSERVFSALTCADDYSKVLSAVQSATIQDVEALIDYAVGVCPENPLDHPVGPAILALCAFKRFYPSGEMAAKLKQFEPLFQHPDRNKLYRYGGTALDIYPHPPTAPWRYYKQDGVWYEQVSASRADSIRLFAPAIKTV